MSLEGSAQKSPGTICGPVVPVVEDEAVSVVQLGAAAMVVAKPRSGKTNATRAVRKREVSREEEVVMGREDTARRSIAASHERLDCVWKYRKIQGDGEITGSAALSSALLIFATRVPSEMLPSHVP